jgi:hypothetical protein
MGTLLSLFALFGLPWWAGMGTLAVRRPEKRARAWWIAIGQGWGLITAAVLPVAIAQPWVVQHTGFDTRAAFLLPAISPGIHAGGRTVTLAFEPLAESGVFGYPQTTMISNWPLFWTLAVAQSLAIAAVLGARLRARDRARLGGRPIRRVDPAIGVLLGVCFLNAALNIAWPWWGS